MIREADDARAELNVARPFSRHGHEDFRRSADLRSRRVMFAAPRFVIAATVEPLDKLEIALQRERRIDAWLVERREKNTESKSISHVCSSRATHLGRHSPDELQRELRSAPPFRLKQVPRTARPPTPKALSRLNAPRFSAAKSSRLSR